MDMIKLVGELMEEVGQENNGTQAPSGKGAKDLRILNELELMLASGGDGIVCW
jgi:hypothetical protein